MQIDFVYNSNSIEGNTLSLGETELELRGITVRGKNITEVLEAQNHPEAIELSKKIAFDSLNGRMYVSNLDDDTVSVINKSSNDVIDTIKVGNNLVGIAYDSLNKRMYVTNAGNEAASVINKSSNDVIKTIKVGRVPFQIAFDLLLG